MRKIVMGVLGCGAFGEKHIASFSQMDHVDLKMICDVDETLVKQTAEKYHVHEWTTDVHQLLEDPEIDAVSIVTPEKLHFEQTLVALKNNKHILVEKPVALHVEQTEELIQKARKKNLVLMPGHILRFEKSYALAKDKLKSMGKIHSIHAKRNLPINLRSIYTRVHPAQMTLPHDIDAVLWFLNSQPTKVYTVDRSTLGNGEVDLVWSLIQFENEAVVCLESSWLLPEREGITPDATMEIIAEKGNIQMTFPSNDIVFSNEMGQERMDTSLWPEVNGKMGGAIVEELEHFIQCVMKEEQSTIIPPEAATESVRLTQAILDSAQAGKEINY